MAGCGPSESLREEGCAGDGEGETCATVGVVKSADQAKAALAEAGLCANGTLSAPNENDKE